jgi:hypothetical protein
MTNIEAVKTRKVVESNSMWMYPTMKDWLTFSIGK